MELFFDRSWKPIQSSTRKDNLQLSHWVRTYAEFPDYPFARFNKKVDIVNYTDEEYNDYVTKNVPRSSQQHHSSWAAQLDGTWTREQTDYLFELAKRYELRWPVIHDRWNFGPRKHLVEMKRRFYSVSAQIIAGRERRKSKASPSSVAHYANVAFDHFAEGARRKRLDSSFGKKKEDIYEETQLRAELKSIDNALRRARRRMGGARPYSADAALENNASNSEAASKFPRSDSEAVGAIDGVPTTRSPEDQSDISYASASAASLRKASADIGLRQSSAQRKQQNVRDAYQGVCLRSDQLNSPPDGFSRESKTVKKTTALLNELDVPQPGKMLACAANLAAYNKLREDIMRMFQLQKAVAAAESRVATLQAQVQTLVTIPVATDRSLYSGSQNHQAHYKQYLQKHQARKKEADEQYEEQKKQLDEAHRQKRHPDKNTTITIPAHGSKGR